MVFKRDKHILIFKTNRSITIVQNSKTVAIENFSCTDEMQTIEARVYKCLQ